MKFSELSQAEFESLRGIWLKEATANEHEVIATDYEQLFGRIDATKGFGPLDDRLNVGVFYTVQDANGKHLALVELVQSRKGMAVWVKMLDMHMCPSIEASPDSEGNTQKRLMAFTVALMGIFELASEVRQADAIKVFGRTDALITFLRGMHDSFSVLTSLGTLKGVETTIEGRWLVFRATKAS
ncbi:MAG: hypothetical protein ACK4E7_04190 [Permianibacter sp.]